MGDVLKSRPGRRRALASGDRLLHRRADVGRDLFARVSLSRLVESKLGVAGAILLSSLASTSLHLQYDWFFFGEVLSIGVLLGYLRYRTNSTWLTIVLHGINNLAATIQTFWLAGVLKEEVQTAVSRGGGTSATGYI